MSACRYWLALVWIAGCGLTYGGDWPTYQYDARRSGCSPDALPGTLALAWQQHLPAYQVAFPNEDRQQFDPSHEPVCADGIVVVGCPADGSVRAFAADSGKELWRFLAEGPVRLAPVLHAGRVLFGSDDGRFHCLDLATGKSLWECRAFPEERPDVHLLGNDRLISLWPVRGGPVVVGDTVYFGSGVWPTMGVYLQARDIATGEPRWTNAELGYLDGVRIDHNQRYDAGISPQGYLLATEDRLIVPNGRSHPVALNRADGSLFHFVQGYRNGHCRVVLGGNYVFVGTSGVLSLVDFREVGSKWLEAGTNAPEAFDGSKFDLYEGPYHPYKKFAGCDADSLFDGDTAYSLVNGVLYVHDLAQSGVSEYEIGQGTQPLKPFRWDARMTLRAATGLGGDTRLFAKAGKTLYGRADNRVVALELTGDVPPVRLAWEIKVPARPTSLIAAADRLFAALEDGSLLCLASGEQPATDLAEPVAAVTPVDSPELKGTELPNAGFCVVLGSLSPGETEALLATTQLRLVVVSGDRTEVDSERRRLARTGCYGTRIERFVGSPLQYRLPPYLASLLWLRGSQLGVPTAAQLDQLWSAVRPYGGKLRFTGTARQCADFARLVESAHLDDALVTTDETAVTVSHPDGPSGAADWTHETADAARTYFSHDEAVRGPLAPLWFGDGPGYGFIKGKDYGRGVKPQVVQGRVFALQQRTATLFAYDAYTGRGLWQTRGDGDDAGFITRFVSTPEGIYVAGKGRCVVYDSATGKELRRMVFATGDEPMRATAVVVSDQSVLIAASAIQTVAIEGGLWDADALICLDRQTGTQRWRRTAQNRFNMKALAIGGDKVYCTDSLSPLATDTWKRRGGDLKECPSLLVAVDERTGEESWRHEYTAKYHQYDASGWLSVRSQDDWLAYAQESGQVLGGRAGTTFLLDAQTGAVVWEKPIGLAQPVVIMGQQVLDQGARLIELATGATIKGNIFHRGGCNYAVANSHLAFVRDQTVCYVDLATGERHRLRNMRSGCSNSLVAASGVLSIPNFAQGCVCNYPVQTSSAWVYAPEVANWGPQEAVTVQPVRTPTGIAHLDPAKVEGMYSFPRRFLVTDPAEAAKHLLARWDFDRPAENLHLTAAQYEPHGEGQALTCSGDTAKTAGQAELQPPGCIQEALTLAAWVRLGDKQHKGAAGIVERPQYYRLMVDQTEPPYSISLSVQTAKGWQSVATPRTIQPGQWVEVVGTFDGEAGELAIYLNGKEVRKTTGQPGRIPPVSAAIAVGVRDGGAYLTGAVDDIRIYDRALTPTALGQPDKQR